MFLKLGAAAAYVVAALVFWIGVEDASVARYLLVSSLAVGALVIVNRGNWSVGPSGLMVLACLAYYVLSLSWSLDWREGVNSLVKIAPFVVLFLVLSRSEKVFEYLPHAACLSVFGALVLATIPIIGEIHGGFGNRNFLAEFLVISLPFVIAGFSTKYLNIFAFITALWAGWFLAFKTTSNIPGFTLAFFLVVLTAWLWKRKKKFLFSVLSLSIMNAMIWIFVLGKEKIKNSILARMELTYNTLAMWLDAPFFGNGSGSFNFAYAGHQEDHLKYIPDFSIFGAITMYPGAAHNEIAQILAEHGIAGLVLVQVLALVLFVHWRDKNRDYLDVAAIWTLGLALWLSLVGFPLHNAATALIVVTAAAVISRGERAWLAGSASTPIAAYAGGVLAVLLLTTTTAHAVSQARLTVARAIIQTPGFDSLLAFRENVRAYDLWPYDQLIRRQLIMTTAKAAFDYGKKLVIEPDAADKIYRISLTAGSHIPSTLISRLDYLLASERYMTSGEEVEGIFSILRKNASRQAITWLADAVYAARIGDFPRARDSTLELLRINNQQPQYASQFTKKIEELFKETTQ